MEHNKKLAQALTCSQSQPLLTSDHNIDSRKPDMKIETCSEIMDFYHLDQIPLTGSSSSPMFRAPTSSYFAAALENYPYTNYSMNADFYECKPLPAGNYIGGHSLVTDNFQCGAYLGNLSERIATHARAAYDQLGMKPVSFVVPDEVSNNVSVDNRHNFQKQYSINKINMPSDSATPASILPARRPGKCRNKSDVVKGQWSSQEDRMLVQLVGQYGVRKWSVIAQMLPGRIGKQCRERWHNHLRPDIKKETWSEEEDRILIQAHTQIGNRWAEIAKKLPGRTENSIKNHWNATKRRQFSKRKCRSKYPRATLLQDYIKSLNLTTSTPSKLVKSSSKNKPTGTVMVSATSTQEQTNKDVMSSGSDRLVPEFDFDEVMIPETISFDEAEKMFQDGCTFDSLLEIDIPSDDEKYDAAEMISQVNASTDPSSAALGMDQSHDAGGCNEG